MLNDTNAENDWAQFLDRLVHDLREPLRSVHVFSELLQETSKERLGKEGTEFLGEIHQGTARMRTLLDGLGAYAGSLRESSAAPSMPASVQSAFKIVLANLDPAIQASGATITGKDLPRVNLSLDRVMLLLENLLGNSLRFRSEAPPVIQVSASEEEDGMWAIHVEDNGIGIAPEDCQTIFQPFMKVEGKKYPGVGLGLSICKRIVEAHGGAITMKSTPGQGSTCTFTLPAA